MTKLFTANEYKVLSEQVRHKITVEKKSKYDEFKEKFLTEFNEEAKNAAILLKNEFEVEYICREDRKKDIEPFINLFCKEISTEYKCVEMYYDDGEDEESSSKKSKGFFGIVFEVINEVLTSINADINDTRNEFSLR